MLEGGLLPNIGRYEVKSVLGQGAMGKVYLAYDPTKKREVAVKVLTVDTQDQDLRARFDLEIRAIATLKHPNIVELYDSSVSDPKQLYLVMEYVPGVSLYALQTKHGRLD